MKLTICSWVLGPSNLHPGKVDKYRDDCIIFLPEMIIIVNEYIQMYTI